MSNKRLAAVYNQVLLLPKSSMMEKGNDTDFVELDIRVSWAGFAEVLCTSALGGNC